MEAAEIKIVCLGDSITYGFPFGPPSSWVRLAAELTGFNLMNRGENGDCTGDMLFRWSRDVVPAAPRAVLIMGGTNDAAVGIPTEEVAGNILKMTALTLSLNALPLLAQPIPAGDPFLENRLEDIRDIVAGIAANNNIPLLDFTPVMAGETSINWDFYCDDVHPSLKGYRAMGPLAASFLQDLANLIGGR